jgi:hypothetical protein
MILLWVIKQHKLINQIKFFGPVTQIIYQNKSYELCHSVSYCILTVVPSIFNQVKDVQQMLKRVVSSFYCAP